MLRLKQKLLTLLKNAERVAVLGIGSDLRGDDAVGLLVLDHLRKTISKRKKSRLSFRSAGRRRGISAKSINAAEILHPDCRRRIGIQDDNKGVPLAERAFELFNGGTAPENLTGEIRRFRPSHLVLIDAVDLGKKPGTIELLNPRDTANVSFFTHKLPIKLMLDYLADEMKFIQFLIGIQPRNLDFAAPVSLPVKKAGRGVADILASAIGIRRRFF
jgi:hydrogenase maturation protease HycI